MKRLKATLLQLCLQKDEDRKPNPKAATRVKSWRTVNGEGWGGWGQGEKGESRTRWPPEETPEIIEENLAKLPRLFGPQLSHLNNGIMTTEQGGTPRCHSHWSDGPPQSHWAVPSSCSEHSHFSLGPGPLSAQCLMLSRPRETLDKNYPRHLLAFHSGHWPPGLCGADVISGHLIPALLNVSSLVSFPSRSFSVPI